MIAYPLFIKSSYLFVGYTQVFEGYVQRKILISNFTYFLVDFNVSLDIKYSFSYQVTKNSQTYNKGLKLYNNQWLLLRQANQFYSNSICVNVTFIDVIDRGNYVLWLALQIVFIFLLLLCAGLIIAYASNKYALTQKDLLNQQREVRLQNQQQDYYDQSTYKESYLSKGSVDERLVDNTETPTKPRMLRIESLQELLLDDASSKSPGSS